MWSISMLSGIRLPEKAFLGYVKFSVLEKIFYFLKETYIYVLFHSSNIKNWLLSKTQQYSCFIFKYELVD